MCQSACKFDPRVSAFKYCRPNDSGYALAAAKALPHATQVADRWHLMENAGQAFHDEVRKSMRRGRAAVGAVAINPDLLTAAERIQYGAVYGVRIPTRQSSNRDGRLHKGMGCWSLLRCRSVALPQGARI